MWSVATENLPGIVDASAAASAWRRPSWRAVGTAVVGIAGCAGLILVAPPDRVLAQFANMSVGWVVAAVLLELASCLSYVVVFQALLP